MMRRITTRAGSWSLSCSFGNSVTTFSELIGQFGGTQKAESKFSLAGRRLGSCMRESKALMVDANQRGSTSMCYDPSFMQGEGLRAEPTANPYSPWKYVTPLSIVIPYHILVRNALSLIKNSLWSLSYSSGVRCGQGRCATCKVTCNFRRIVVLGMYLNGLESRRCPRIIWCSYCSCPRLQEPSVKECSAERRSSYCFNAVRITQAPPVNRSILLNAHIVLECISLSRTVSSCWGCCECYSHCGRT